MCKQLKWCKGKSVYGLFLLLANVSIGIYLKIKDLEIYLKIIINMIVNISL